MERRRLPRCPRPNSALGWIPGGCETVGSHQGWKVPWWFSLEQGPASDQIQAPSSRLHKLAGYQDTSDWSCIWSPRAAMGLFPGQDAQDAGIMCRQSSASHRPAEASCLGCLGPGPGNTGASGKGSGRGCLRIHPEGQTRAECSCLRL